MNASIGDVFRQQLYPRSARETDQTVRIAGTATLSRSEVAPKANEITYRSQAPRSTRAMWKIVRYAVDGANVVGIGTFPSHATLFFYRGRDLDDGSGLLQGGGKNLRFITLRAPADAERPVVKRLVRKAFKLGGTAMSGIERWRRLRPGSQSYIGCFDAQCTQEPLEPVQVVRIASRSGYSPSSHGCQRPQKDASDFSEASWLWLLPSFERCFPLCRCYRCGRLAYLTPATRR